MTHAEERAYLVNRLRQIADYHEGVAKHYGNGWHDDAAVTLRDAATLLETGNKGAMEPATSFRSEAP